LRRTCLARCAQWRRAETANLSRDGQLCVRRTLADAASLLVLAPRGALCASGGRSAAPGQDIFFSFFLAGPRIKVGQYCCPN
jgi:hypothetical protein